MNFEKRLQEIEKRKLEIREMLSDTSVEINLDEIETELRKLEAEKKEIEKRMALAKALENGQESTQEIPKPEQRNDPALLDPTGILATPEYRSAFLKRLQGKELTEIEKRALTTAQNSAGGAVPLTTFNKIIDKLRQTSALFDKINVTYIPGNTRIIVADAKNAATWKAEGVDGTPADDTVVTLTLTGFELIKLVELSAAAEAMTIDAFEEYITKELGRQMGIAIENAIVNGDGNGQPTGILAGITWDTTNSLAYSGTITYDVLMDAMALLPTMYHQNAVFVMNRKTLFGGIRKIKDNVGSPIFIYNAQDKPAMTILGYPVIMDDYVPDDTIILGDMQYYYMNISKAPTIDVSREAAFKSGKVTYRGLMVADGKPALAEAFVKIYKSAV